MLLPPRCRHYADAADAAMLLRQRCRRYASHAIDFRRLFTPLPLSPYANTYTHCSYCCRCFDEDILLLY